MNKNFTAGYLVLISIITAAVYLLKPFSVTALIMTAAFIINIFLFVGAYKKNE